MTWWRFWVDTFLYFPDGYDMDTPWADHWKWSLCRLIMPCADNWVDIYYYIPPANDNEVEYGR